MVGQCEFCRSKISKASCLAYEFLGPLRRSATWRRSWILPTRRSGCSRTDARYPL